MSNFYTRMRPDENMGWCKPISLQHGNRRAVISVNEQHIAGVACWSGARRVHPTGLEALATSGARYDSALPEIARWLGCEEIDDAQYKEPGCRACPFRAVCARNGDWGM